MGGLLAVAGAGAVVVGFEIAWIEIAGRIGVAVAGGFDVAGAFDVAVAGSAMWNSLEDAQKDCCDGYGRWKRCCCRCAVTIRGKGEARNKEI